MASKFKTKILGFFMVLYFPSRINLIIHKGKTWMDCGYGTFRHQHGVFALPVYYEVLWIANNFIDHLC